MSVRRTLVLDTPEGRIAASDLLPDPRSITGEFRSTHLMEPIDGTHRRNECDDLPEFLRSAQRRFLCSLHRRSRPTRRTSTFRRPIRACGTPASARPATPTTYH